MSGTIEQSCTHEFQPAPLPSVTNQLKVEPINNTYLTANVQQTKYISCVSVLAVATACGLPGEGLRVGGVGCRF